LSLGFWNSAPASKFDQPNGEFSMTNSSLQFLEAIVKTPSPSGYEAKLAELFRSYIGPFVKDVQTDVMGNVVAVINPDAAFKVMIAAHIDEIGLMIHHIDDDGFLHFQMIGGNDSVIADGQRVWVQGAQQIAGVVGRKSMTVQSPSEQKQKPTSKELWIDIGAKSKEEADGVVSLGDIATFQPEFQALLGGRATGRAFDNKAGVFAMAEAMRYISESGNLSPEIGVYAVASVQEEIGSRGAQTAAFSIAPDIAIAIDMGVATDIPTLLPHEYGLLALGKGPAISRGPNTNPVLYGLLRVAAVKSGRPFQIRPDPASSPTDARVLQITRGGAATALLEVPLRYMHTPCEVLDLEDVDGCARLLAEFCESLEPGVNLTP
jgi:putative aminopeptidase FrvX